MRQTGFRDVRFGSFAAIAYCPGNEGFSCERYEYGLCWMKAQENPTRKSARDC
jgi:hypothetical protein